MICGGCGEKNREGARFCMFCGTTLAVRCDVCDTELIAGARFCDACGAQVGASQGGPAPAVRKIVTVLFSDLTGSTALEERMDAESVRSVLDRFYGAMRRETERFGGVVVKFTGDGAMSAFGIRDVKEDDAPRAIDAALAMHAECEQLASDLGLPLALKIGINTGEVVVSETDEDVVGDCVNVAARLEGAAGAGEILVGEETWRLTRGTSRYEAIPPLNLKGKSEPVPAFRLLAVDERTAEAASAPFVGRDVELGRALGVFQDAVDANAARLITIVGAPGLGKTRLARELMTELEGQALIRETRCDPGGAGTFTPIADALRGASATPDLTSEDDVKSAIAATIPADADDRDRIVDLVAAVVGAGEPGSTEETFWALRRLIESAAAVEPVVIFLDDVHWAEPVLLDLMEHLAEWIRDVPVLIVLTARPELRDLRPSLTESGRFASVIALEGLDDVATARLALNLLGTDELPAELLSKIPASTQGNPLFVREFVRMLVEDGVLLRGADGWNLTVDVDAIQVPPTIQSLLAARVDRLRADERSFLEIAAVVGKEFYKGALEELAPPAIRDHLDGCLESLRRKELIEPAGTYWIDEPVYRFHHVLIRDAAYRRVLKESRADVHERVADWLERKTEGVLGDRDELIGYHLEQAHENLRQLGRANDDLGRRAAGFLGVGARRALDRDDLPAAAALSARALDRFPADDGLRPELLLIRCEALLSMGDVVAGSHAFAELRAAATTERLEAWVTCFAGQLANLSAPERLEEIEAEVAAAAVRLDTLGDPAGAAKAHTVHAATLARLGRFADCEAVLDFALNGARAANDRRRITAVLGSAPHAALWGPSPVSRAGGRCLDITRLLRITTGAPAVEATSNRCQAVLEAFRGRADASRRMLRSVRRTLTELGLRHDLLETDQFEGIVELSAGEPAAAIDLLQRAYEGFVASGVGVLAGQSAALLARAYLVLGEVEEAARYVDESERLGGQDLKASIAWRAVRAELLARRGEIAEARRLAEAAVELASRTDALIDHADACRALGAVCAAAGDTAGARSANDRAASLYERKGATALLAAPAEPEPVMSVPPRADVGNAAFRVALRLHEAFPRREWEVVRALAAERVHFDDRRTLFAADRVLERDEYVAGWNAIAGLGATRSSVSLVAIRGERLALVKARFSSEDTGSVFAVEMLFLYSLDGDGRVDAHVLFEPDDLDEAFDELTERFVAGEGAPYAEIVREVTRNSRSINERRWEFPPITPDFRFVDHRPASLGEARDTVPVADAQRSLVDLIPDLRVQTTRFVELRPEGCIADVNVTGTTQSGSPVDLSFFTLMSFREGRMSRLEYFPPDALDSAIAAFNSSRIDALENRASRYVKTSLDAMRRGDWDAVAAGLAPDVVTLDRRAGLGSDAVGPDLFVKNFRTVADLGLVRITDETLAVRGEDLALGRGLMEDPSGNVLGGLVLVETNEQGLAQRLDYFDLEDETGAFAELERRHAQIASGGLENRCTRAVAKLFEAFERKDLDEFLSMHAETFTHDDRRSGVRHVIQGREELIELVNAYWDVGGVHADIETLAIRGERLALNIKRYRYVDSDGTVAYEAPQLIVDEIDEHDRAAVVAVFDLDDLLSAIEELDSRYLASEYVPTATRSALLFTHATNRRDEEGLRQLFTDEGVFVNHTPVSFDLIDLATYFEWLAEFPSYAVYIVRVDAVAPSAVLAETRFVGTTSDGSETEWRHLTLGIGDGTKLKRIEIFPDEDIDAARARLSEFATVSHALENMATRLGRELHAAYDRRDFDAFAGLLTEDSFLEDRRVGLSTTIRGRTARTENMRAIVGVGGVDITAEPIAIRGDRFVLLRFVVKGSGDRAFEAEFLQLDEYTADGLLAVSTLYDVANLDEALAEMDRRFTGSSSGVLDNPAARAAQHLCDTLIARDWTSLERMYAPDVVLEDRRTGSGAIASGVDESVAWAQAIAHVGTESVEVIPEAVRGDRLVLGRIWFRNLDSAAPIEVEILQVCEFSDRGLMVYAGSFDPDDLAGALAELERRYIAGEGAEYADVWMAVVDAVTALDRHDWDAFRSYYSDDATMVDHRPASLGTIGSTNDLIASLQVQSELTPGIRTTARSIEAIGPQGVLYMPSRIGETPEGAQVEITFYGLMVVREGKIARMEFFPLEARDAALEAFEQLSPNENEATRVAARIRDAIDQDDWATVRTLVDDRALIDDRRSGIASTGIGADAFINSYRTAHELGFVALPQKIIATRGDHLALHSGDMEDAHGNRIGALVIIETKDGRARALTYLDHDEGAAVAELERRSVAATGEVTRCMVVMDAVVASWEAGDWEKYAALASPDVRVEDRRRGMANELIGRDAFLEGSKAIQGVGATRLRAETVALRGERLSLTRNTFGADGALADFETTVVFVNEIDENGLYLTQIAFDLEDVDKAFEELDQRWFAGEGAGVAAKHLITAPPVLHAARNWPGFRKLLNDRHVFVDHRPASLGTVEGADAFISVMTSLLDVIPDLRMRMVADVYTGERVVAAMMLGFGTAASEAPVELPFYNVAVIEGDVLVRQEFFAVEDREAAITRARELDERRSRLENDATRAVEGRVNDFLNGALDAVAARYAEDCLLEDRRPGLGVSFHGRSAVSEVYRAIREMGVARVDLMPIATRGTRLALHHIRLGGALYEDEILNLDEIDEQGRITATILFASDDVQAALAQLDDLFIRGEGSPYAELLRAGAEQRRAIAAADFAAYRRLMAEDLLLIDHRRASLGEVRGVDDAIAAVRGMAPLLRDVEIRVVAYHAIAADRMLLEVAATGTATHGGSVEIAHLRLQRSVEGRVMRMELFELDDLERALFRFHQLRTDRTNVAARALEASLNAALDTSSDQYVAFFAPDCVINDRRRGVGMDYDGHEGVRGMVEGALRIGVVSLRADVLAKRSESVSLQRMTVSGVRYETELLVLCRVDDRGLIVHVVLLDPGDHDLAFALLDEIFAEASPFGDVILAASRPVRARNARDWDALREALTDDYLMVDNRPASAGRIVGPEAFIAYLKPLREMLPDSQVRAVAFHALASGWTVGEWHTVGTNENGDPVEIVQHVVMGTRDGKLAYSEFFGADDLQAALARFHELSGVVDDVPSSFRTPCLGVCIELIEAFEAADWDRGYGLVSPRVIVDDRRPGMRHVLDGADALILGAQTIYGVGGTRMRFEPIAVRGDRLVLSRNTITGEREDGPAFEGVVLFVNEIDEEGRYRAQIVFDPEDDDSAMAELDARYLEGEGASHRDAVSRLFDLFATYNRRDWQAMRGFYRDDVVLVDHRPASLGEVRGVDAVLDTHRALVDVISGLTVRLAAVHRVTDHALAFSLRGSGHNADGGVIESGIEVVAIMRDGVGVRVEYFPEDGLDEALARFDELTRDPSGLEPNFAFRSQTRSIHAQSTGGWEAVADTLTDDVVFEDRRSGLAWRLEGKDAVLEHLKVSFSAGGASDETLIATRGEHLCLSRQVIRSLDFEVAVLVVNEVDDAGRARHCVFFNDDDLDAAFTELDELFLCGEGAEHATFWNNTLPLIDAIRAQDGETIARFVTEHGTTIEDHRPASFGSDTGFETIFVEPNLVGGVRFDVIEIVTINPRSGCARVRVTARTPEGGDAEWVFLAVVTTDLARLELFDADQQAAAESRVRELATI